MKVINESNFEAEVSQSDEVVLVDFWAPWCTPCNMLTPVLEELSDKYTVGKVNVDEEKELSVKYSISAIPALKFFKNGEVVKSLVGMQSKEEIIAAFEELTNG